MFGLASRTNAWCFLRQAGNALASRDEAGKLLELQLPVCSAGAAGRVGRPGVRQLQQLCRPRGRAYHAGAGPNPPRGADTAVCPGAPRHTLPSARPQKGTFAHGTARVPVCPLGLHIGARLLAFTRSEACALRPKRTLKPHQHAVTGTPGLRGRSPVTFTFKWLSPADEPGASRKWELGQTPAPQWPPCSAPRAAWILFSRQPPSQG